MITGEERLRENLADLYSNVSDYEGRPSKTQVERADALSRELGDVVKDLDGWVTRELGKLNPELAVKNLGEIRPLTREEWDRTNSLK